MKRAYAHKLKRKTNYLMRVMQLNYYELARKRYVRSKIEIIGFVQGVLLEMMIPFEFQKECE